jgi:hypothetical protein
MEALYLSFYVQLFTSMNLGFLQNPKWDIVKSSIADYLAHPKYALDFFF